MLNHSSCRSLFCPVLPPARSECAGLGRDCSLYLYEGSEGEKALRLTSCRVHLVEDRCPTQKTPSPTLPPSCWPFFGAQWSMCPPEIEEARKRQSVSITARVQISNNSCPCNEEASVISLPRVPEFFFFLFEPETIFKG